MPEPGETPNPILILQMQRMGDLVLSFPLEGWLNSRFPQTPLWVVGEPLFYKGLIPLSPPVTYFAYADAQALRSRAYSLIINLSHRREAAALASSLKAEQRLGPWLDPQGNLRVSGPWQLYRASLSHNNRHNLFHWADLNAMDLVPASSLLRTRWPEISQNTPGQGKVGLFVGASEQEKRPDPPFWAALASRISRMGAQPILLGGSADQSIADEVVKLSPGPIVNLCGKFAIPELCRLIRQLDLFITPDTGPMHLAAWLGTPVLNLSLGPVNAWETAPFAPGHHVLQSSLSCAGCWSCPESPPRCKTQIHADQAAMAARLILEKKPEQLVGLELRNLRLLVTGRDPFGLFQLTPLRESSSPRLARSSYWKYFFGLRLGFLPPQAQTGLWDRAQALREHKITPLARQAGQTMIGNLAAAIRGQRRSALQSADAWLQYPPFFRPLSSYLQYLLHNADFSSAALNQALELTEAYLTDMTPS